MVETTVFWWPAASFTTGTDIPVGDGVTVASAMTCSQQNWCQGRAAHVTADLPEPALPVAAPGGKR